MYENGIFESEPNNAYAGNYENYYHSEELIDDYYGGGGDDLVLCIAYTDSYIAAMNEEYTRARAAVTEWLPTGAFVACLCCCRNPVAYDYYRRKKS